MVRPTFVNFIWGKPPADPAATPRDIDISLIKRENYMTVDSLRSQFASERHPTFDPDLHITFLVSALGLVISLLLLPLLGPDLGVLAVAG
jgi:hypothetical protein